MKKIFSSIFKGAKDAVPVIATLKSHYIKDADGKVYFRIDWPRLLTCLGIVAVFVALVAGKIDAAQFLEFIEKALN